ncbi:MAG: SdrD B-like domain-containing protein [Candidatus Electrothrix aestuarii]|uniref:SdrD B-like domain-containing protein n=1 Tax=Candidatus Electrothrix aestuarii TaxID=3062594 RepID=A0AAU8LXL5_9BACT|nr:SdrD B-like domain-containing protein [Candidatus Electrothrix aestuarii]
MNAQSKKYIKKRMPDKSSGAGLTGNFLWRMLVAVFLAMLLPLAAAQAAGNPDGQLRIEIISAYNLVVDSNVTTPATYAPEAATLGAKVCNDGTEVMNEVQVYIGDYTNKDHPGTYPVFDSAGDSRTWLQDTGEYSLTHESGSFASAEDASRAWVGTLQPGECRVEYWVVSYPRCVNVDDGTGTYISQEPPCDTAITGGSTTADDIALSYDIWATGSYGAAGTALEAEDSRDLTLRSEISASANKIWPNGDNKVPEEYKAAIEESLGWDTWTPTGSNPFPGQVFETQGIWYDLGNVVAGFDNNGDGVPDQNAWLQPVGIPDVYDPGCFRLVGTYGLLIVKGTDGGETLIPFKDQMYFENIPDNTGVVGLVFYEYAALNGKCTGTLTPYQEVASGFYNEKFSGDYGTAFQITTQEPLASIAKGVSPETAGLGSELTYTLEVTNPDDYGLDSEGEPLTVTIGDPDSGNPLVIRDTIPPDTNFLLNSAKVVEPDSDIAAADVTILYTYSDGITTWTTTEAPTVQSDADPATFDTADDVVALEWRAEVGLGHDGGGKSMKVEFKAGVPGDYAEDLVTNTGCAAIGSGPCFDEDDAVTLIEGDKTISGTVFLDDGTGSGTAANGVLDGTEPGEGSVTVTLYYDTNGDGELDDGDIQWGDPIETSTGVGTTGDYEFTNLPDAKFIVVVNDSDDDITAGSAPTTDTEIPADLTDPSLLIDTDSDGIPDLLEGIDFGFIPPLEVTKVAVDGVGPYGDGEDIIYQLTLRNQLPATGSNVGGKCVYTLFPSQNVDASTAWTNPDNIYAIDGGYADVDVGSNSDTAGWNEFNMPASVSGTIDDVRIIVYEPQRVGAANDWDDGESMTATITSSAFTDTVTSDVVPLTTIISSSTYEYIGLYEDRPAGWQWSDISTLTVNLTTNKSGNPTDNFRLDAVALQVTSSEPCGSGSSDIISEIRLQDEYNNTELSYQSSSPERDSWTDSGTTTTQVWDNLGPLAPGESKVVTVTMKGINNSTVDTDIVNALNTARVADGDAVMENGRIANSGEATAEVDIIPAIDISGTLFSDTTPGWFGTTGDNSSEDIYLSGQTVELWACTETATGIIQTDMDGSECDTNSLSWAVVATSTTDEDGNYIFEGVTEGYYYVKAPDTSSYGGTITAAPSDASRTPTSGSGVAGDQWWSNPGNSDSLNGVDVATLLKVGGTGTYDDASNIDFGYGGVPGSVSGHIWEDINSSLSADLSGEYLSGITVELIDLGNDCDFGGNGQGADSIAATVVTDADGFYQFTELTDGQCYAINVLTNIPAEGDTGATGALSSGSWTAVYEAANGEVNPPGSDTPDEYIRFTAYNGQFLVDRDFGYEAPNEGRQIDGKVYYDLDGDGTQSANELGVAGLTVYLYQDEDGDGVVDEGTDALYTSVTTNPDGSYSFPNLPSQNFIVVVDDTPITTYQQIEDPDVAPGGGVCVGTQCDSDGKADVTSGNVNNLDFGFQPPQAENSISGLVWTDLDGDTTKNSSAEAGIGDVTVTLQWTPDNGITWLDVDSQTASDGTVDVDGDGTADPVGSYYFGELPNGTYRVAVSETDTNLPQGLGGDIYAPTTGEDAGTYRYFEQALTGSTASTGNDFGFTPTGAIGDSVYWDVNGDGTQGSNEPGIENVMVELFTFTDTDGDGRWDIGEPVSATPYASTATGTDGSYLFPGLPDGNYVVKVGTIPGDPQITADPDADGDVCPAAGDICDNQHGVAVNGNSYMGADFGYEPPLFIGDQLFIDMDGDGSPMEEGDLPLANVTVTLSDGTNTYIVETDENGNYYFVKGATDLNGNEIVLNSGSYTITVDSNDFPTEYGTLTPSYNGHDSGALDSSIELTLGSDPIDDADMGFKFPPVNDLSGTVCLEGTTGGDGYCGTGLNATNGIDSSTETAYTGTTVYVSKWTDANNDGNVDAGELVPITQTVTDSNGDYSFTGLPSVSESNESYLVSLEAPADLLSLTTDLADTPATTLKEYTDTDGYTTSTWQSISPSSTTTAGLDFAFELTASFDFGDLPLPFETTLDIDGARHVVTPNLYLGSTVTVEADGKPSIDANADIDDGIVPVNPDCLSSTSNTDSWSSAGGAVEVTAVGDGWLVGWLDFNGDGSLSGSGEMIISYEVIGGQVVLPNDDGTSMLTSCVPFDIPGTAFDGDGNFKAPGYARFRLFPEKPPVPTIAFKGIAYDGEVEDYLFNLAALSTIGDTILLDSDGDGVTDEPVVGVVVELQNKYCNAGVDCPTAVTDTDGHYLFTGVGTGEYTVVVKEFPPTYTDTYNILYDPDTTADGKTTINITEPGTVHLDADFWYTTATTPLTTGTIGDRIWNDADGDGVQDMGESGIGGITIELRDGTCTPSSTCETTTTAPDGSYSFTGLSAGDYTIVVVDPPSGTTQTGDPDATKDNSTMVSLAAGQTILTADFGYEFPETGTSDIGDLVWIDADGDGIQDEGENGIPGVTIALKDSDGKIIAVDVTDSDGNYLFPDLPQGTYTVEVTDENGVLDIYTQASVPPGTTFDSVNNNPLYKLTTDPSVSTEYLDVDFGYLEPIPTYAIVSSFKAYVNGKDQTVLEWKTASEIGTIGFMLERLNEQTGQYQTVNTEILPGLLMPPHGGTYRYVDKTATPGMNYTYRVVEVAANAQGTVSGPYTVQAQTLLPAKQLVDDGPEGYSLANKAYSKKQLRRFAARNQAVRQLATVQASVTGNTLKIPVSNKGLVYLTATELATASGFSEAQVAQYLKAKLCLVTLAGETIPVITANTGSGLWFYGQAPERNDIGQNVYLLQLGAPGAKVKNTAKRAKTSVNHAQSFVSHKQFEENQYPFQMYINKPVSDFWAWDYLYAPGSKDTFTHTVATPRATGLGKATVTVNLVGIMSGNSDELAPYSVRVLLNGSEIGVAEWSEKGDYRFQAEVDAMELQDGDNEIQLIAQLNSGVSYSFIYIESFEIDYGRSYEAINGELFFNAEQNDSITVSGLTKSNVLVLDITDPNAPKRVRTLPGKDEAGDYTITVLTEPGHSYFLTENLGESVSGTLTVDSSSDLRNTGNQADYLIITSSHLLDSAQRLADYRATQGLTPMVVDIEDIQDEFSASLAAPEVLRDFLAYAYENWTVAPRYVVLIGDGSYDYKNYLGYGYPTVPSLQVRTEDGYFPSDNVFADVVGNDGIPEFALGRIPTVNTVELDNYIDKLITYEQFENSGALTTTLINDRSDRGGDFQASAEKVEALVAGKTAVKRLSVSSSDDISTTHTQIVNALQEGTGIMHYIGHSSMVGLGKTSALLASSELGNIELGAPMLMVSMSCSAASYGYPAMDSLGEAAVLQAGGSAVGFFGASGTSLNNMTDVMAEGFYTSLFEPGNQRLGDAVKQAKKHYGQQGVHLELLNIYNLLGDPATLVPHQN